MFFSANRGYIALAEWDGAMAGHFLPAPSVLSGLENSWRVHKLQTTVKSPESQAVAMGGGGHSHRSTDLTHHLFQQSSDQRGFSAGSSAEHHHNQITTVQFLTDTVPLGLKSLPSDVIL